MTASTITKGLLGLATAAVMGAAFAQGTPPNPNVTNPAVGAGQQSSQNTPMGTTGTQGAGGAATATTGSTAGSTSTGSSASTMGASSDTGMSTGTTRPQRADRN
jgi:hypothetical protein